MRKPSWTLGWLLHPFAYRRFSRLSAQLTDRRILAPASWPGSSRIVMSSGSFGPREHRVGSIAHTYQLADDEPVMIVEAVRTSSHEPVQERNTASLLAGLSGRALPSSPGVRTEREVLVSGLPVMVRRTTWPESPFMTAQFRWRDEYTIVIASWDRPITEEFLGQLQEVEDDETEAG
ncbi:hypothetical protein [Actinomadura rupiterrae]|uniref:hypothetical protein n=1 Tax=Actinomadura rupiterrae TaxID=559627 RepID=UPI0020A248A0|nr:hypothetical protein [Actinomadura rupiterrae]MCP2337565.1 hypothetical protein [Actinomadura rupiterrae]